MDNVFSWSKSTFKSTFSTSFYIYTHPSHLVMTFSLEVVQVHVQAKNPNRVYQWEFFEVEWGSFGSFLMWRYINDRIKSFETTSPLHYDFLLSTVHSNSHPRSGKLIKQSSVFHHKKDLIWVIILKEYKRIVLKRPKTLASIDTESY